MQGLREVLPAVRDGDAPPVQPRRDAGQQEGHEHHAQRRGRRTGTIYIIQIKAVAKKSLPRLREFISGSDAK